MICKKCKKDLGNDNIPICKECFFKELLWIYRDNPNVYEDIGYRKMPDGTIEEIEVIRGLAFKENALEKIKEDLENE